MVNRKEAAGLDRGEASSVGWPLGKTMEVGGWIGRDPGEDFEGVAAAMTGGWDKVPNF